ARAGMIKMMRWKLGVCVLLSAAVGCRAAAGFGSDPLRDLQTAAIDQNKSPAAHWGTEPDNYTAWGTHSNRLIPVYTYGTRGGGPGVDLDSYLGAKSVYRREEGIRGIFGKLPTNTLNPDADYMDETELAALQRAALAAGKKHIFLVIFDGMDWQTTRAA